MRCPSSATPPWSRRTARRMLPPTGSKSGLPTQDGETALAIAADAAGVPSSNVIVHKMMLGCGFGRRGIFQDFVRQAVMIAKEVGQPVKLV